MGELTVLPFHLLPTDTGKYSAIFAFIFAYHNKRKNIINMVASTAIKPLPTESFINHQTSLPPHVPDED